MNLREGLPACTAFSRSDVSAISLPTAAYSVMPRRVYLLYTSERTSATLREVRHEMGAVGDQQQLVRVMHAQALVEVLPMLAKRGW